MHWSEETPLYLLSAYRCDVAAPSPDIYGAASGAKGRGKCQAVPRVELSHITTLDITQTGA